MTTQNFCQNCAAGVQPGELVCSNCGQMLRGPRGVSAAAYGPRLLAYVLDVVLIFVTLIIGYIIWWLFTLSNGQTPGKQIVGLRAIRSDGTELGWSGTFMREFLVKAIVFGIIGWLTSWIAWIVSCLWPLWDRHKQALHDKVASTLVVANARAEATAGPSVARTP